MWPATERDQQVLLGRDPAAVIATLFHGERDAILLAISLQQPPSGTRVIRDNGLQASRDTFVCDL